MSYSYLVATVDLAAKNIATLRFIIGDRRAATHLLEDEELQALLDTYCASATTVDAAVIPGIDAMIRAAGEVTDWASGSEHETPSQRLVNLRKLRGELVAQGKPDPAGGGGSRQIRFTRFGATTPTEVGR